MEKVHELVTAPQTDIVLCAIVGTAGLEPVIAALRAGKRVALASKEVLVLAGEIIERELAANPSAELIPVDSEHSAIFQCLAGRKHREIRNLYLTASAALSAPGRASASPPRRWRTLSPIRPGIWGRK